jgi:hypothetical protein
MYKKKFPSRIEFSFEICYRLADKSFYLLTFIVEQLHLNT